MLDLYLVITPIFGVLTLLTIINLKFTLKEPKLKQLSKFEKKKQEEVEHNLVKSQQHEVSGFKKTFLYFLKNFTLAEFLFVRRSRNKIPLLLSLSIIAILSIAIKAPYTQFIFSIVGILTLIPFIIGKMLTNQAQQKQVNNQNERDMVKNVKQSNEEQNFEQKLQVLFSCISLLLNIAVIWTVYKNYNNNYLSIVAQNFLISVAFDNCIIKPIVLTIVSFPIKDHNAVNAFIENQNQIVQILHEERVIKRVFDAHISALSPKKLTSSPSKVPKAIQIQPRINSSDKQAYLTTLQLTKILRKPKLSPIVEKKADYNQLPESSLNSIFNSSQKKTIQRRHQSIDFDKSLFEQRVEQQEPIPDHSQSKQSKQNQDDDSKFSFQTRKRNKLYSSKLIMINQDQSIIHNLQNDIQNQEQEDFNNNKSINKSLRDSDYRGGSKNCDGLKISLHRSIEEDNENHDNFNDFFEQNQNDPNYQCRPHSTLEEDNSILGQGAGVHSSRRNGLLKINEDRKGQDLQQIDLNSPQRRKNHLSKIIEDANGQISKPKKKKGYKKYSLDPNRHVIKHSTGQPYLQFLPNLLNKQREEKKKKSTQQSSQQVFSRKIEMMNGFINESRLIKSVKKAKNTKDPIVRQNDENQIPEFIIEDFN